MWVLGFSWERPRSCEDSLQQDFGIEVKDTATMEMCPNNIKHTLPHLKRAKCSLRSYSKASNCDSATGGGEGYPKEKSTSDTHNALGNPESRRLR